MKDLTTKLYVKYLSLLSWRRPWIWLLGLFLTYNLVLAVIAPIIIKSRLNDLVVNQLKLNLDIDGISINPYAFTLKIDNVKISGQDLEEPLGFSQFFMDLDLWDSLGGIWTINEAYLTGVYGEFKRINDTKNNFTNIINNWTNFSTDPTSATTENKTPAPIPQWKINDARVHVAQFHFVDQFRKKPFSTNIGPIEFHVTQLSNLPDNTSQQSLLLKTSAGIELSWKGNLALQPFSSEGEATLNGPVITTLAEYLSNEIDISATTGNFQSQFKFRIHKPDNADIEIQVSDIHTNAEQLTLNQISNKEPLLSLKQATINNGEFTWPEARIQLPAIELHTGDVWITSTPQGGINWAQLVSQSESNTESSSWKVANTILSAKGIQLHYIDKSPNASAQLDAENLALEIKNLSNKPNQKVSITTSFNLQGGKFESAASVNVNPLTNAEGTYKITQLPAKSAQSFIDDYAKVTITEGTLSSEGKITSKGDIISIQGNAQIDQFNLQDSVSEKNLLSWSKLRLNRIIANTNEKKIDIGRMRFSEAFADFNIYKDGSHTLSQILIDSTTATTDATAAESAQNTDEFRYLIGRIDFDNASGKFSDASLPLPFSADISKINGSISTFDSTSHTPANIKLEGQVSDYGEMIMNGAVFPLEPTQKTQMNVAFNNIDIAELSPYSIKFAGREIAKGKMDLDLDYTINKSQMNGNNNIVLRDFALGKKVAHPGAADLPLDLAIALLKDKDGVIRTDLPVQGNVDDPKFDYGKTVRLAIRKLITNVAAAPFRFLASLVGVGKNKDLGYISFFAGRTDLSPAQKEKVNQLGEALIKRPDLRLTIAGSYLASFDTTALKEEKLNAKLREQVSTNPADTNIGSGRYIAVLEDLYQEHQLTPSLEELKKTAQHQANDDQENLDRLTYVKLIKGALVEREVVTQEDLIQLANQRAQLVYDQLSQIPGVKSTQIKLGSAREGQLNKDNKLKLELQPDLKKTKKSKSSAASQ